MATPGFQWTAKNVEILRAEYANGLSFSQIARVLGGISRNAVIGKATRLKLGDRTGIRPPQSKRAPRPPTLRAQIAAVQAEAQIVPDPIPSERISLLDLTHGSCRFPFGDPREPDFGFCGHQTVPGRSWCMAHLARVYGNGTASERSATHLPKTVTGQIVPEQDAA